LDGEVDLVHAANIAAVVEELVQQAVTEVTADLSQLTFIDASGINALVRSNQMVSAVNGRMVIIGANPWLRRVFAAAGVADTLPVTPGPPTPNRETTSAVGGAQPGDFVEGGTGNDDLIQNFVALAGVLLTEPTTTGNLRRVIDTAVSTVPGCTAASISVMALGAPRSAAVTNRVAVEVDIAQYILDEGPCLDAARDSYYVRFDVLESDRRFVHFAPLALEAGVRAVLSIPIVVADQTVGSLNVYSDSDFGPHAEAVAEVLAAQTATALATSDILTSVGRIAGTAQRRFDDLAEITVAEAVLAGLHQVSVKKAGTLLGSAATADSETLVEAARRIIATVAHQGSHPQASI